MLKLKIPPDTAFELLQERIKGIEKIRKNSRGGSEYSDFIRWGSTTITVLEGIYGSDDKHIRQLRTLENPSPTGDESIDTSNLLVLYGNLLLSYMDEINIFVNTPEFQESTMEEQGSIDKIDYLESIFDKFHLVATQLKRRRKGKTPFLINDESDVQDLLKALMTPVFEDIRDNEPTPSYAGQYSLIDFTIKEKKVAIETKFASDTHLDDKIGNELLEDIPRYKKNQSYNLLICFIYDPEFKLKKASSLKSDLESESSSEFDIKVIIEPNR
jgi:hypothetical protein